MNRFLITALLGALVAAAPAADRPNILFVPIDDLNHWVGHLGRNAQTRTPNLDRLAASGVSFSRAYCAAPACNPSRAALMSGRRPSSTGIYRNQDPWKSVIPPEQTLNVHLRSAGYHTLAGGKIYHGGVGRAEDWDEVFERPKGLARAAALKAGGAGKLSYRQLAGGDEVLVDHHVVSWAVEQLRKERDEPFFLACGIFRPHLPWDVPKKYFDMHPLEGIELPPFKADDLDDLPPAGRRMARALGDHARVTADHPDRLWKELVQAYLASVSFADAQLGRLLEALDEGPHRDNTIVVLWGDHGWSLGEKSHWRKFALWEEPTRAPLIWRVPGVTKPGQVRDTPVGFINIFPTLCDLAGIAPAPHGEGVSLRPLLRGEHASWTRPVITTHGYENHAVRSGHWRYIRYADGGEELYDRSADPLEHRNLAGLKEHRETCDRLSSHLPATNVGPNVVSRRTAVKTKPVPRSWSERMARRLPESEKVAPLFDGKTLAGWKGDEKLWSADAERGWIIGRNDAPVRSSSYLFTDEPYREFRLLFEVKQVVSPRHSTMHSAIAALGERIEDAGDNPFGFRGPLLMFCHDWGIWDAHRRNRIEPKGHRGTLELEAENTGKWNQLEILARGNRIRFVANGVLVFDFTDEPDMLKASPIGLQLHSNRRPQEFRFRGLWLSEAPGDALLTLRK